MSDLRSQPAIRIGAKLPNSGPWPERLGLAGMATTLENAGFDSMWVGDHIAVRQNGTPYPYRASGRMLTAAEDPWYDSVVAMTVAAAVTSRCEIGVGVLVLPLRPALLVSKQIASLDAVARGRIVLGVGAGWMRDEFDALGVDFEGRGRALEEGIGILRQSWTGRLGDLVCQPTPARPVPVLIGGMSAVACRRVATIGDGWYAVQNGAELDPAGLAARLDTIRAVTAPRAFTGPVVLRITACARTIPMVADALDDLVAAGVTEVVVDVAWDEPDAAVRTFEQLAAARSCQSVPFPRWRR